MDVRFKEFQPLPAFLIRLANVSVLLDVGKITGTVENITPDQATLGTPLTLAFSGDQLKGLQGMTLNGTLDHRDASQSTDNFRFQATGYRLEKVSLSNQPDWPVAVDKGSADVNVDAELHGEAITATGISKLSALRVSAGQTGDSNPLTNALSLAISDISAMSVKATVTGTIQHYDLKLSSDLDRILQEAAGKMMKNLATGFGKDLQSAISARVGGPLKGLNTDLGGLGSISEGLTERLTEENDLLKILEEKGLPKKALPRGFKLPF